MKLGVDYVSSTDVRGGNDGKAKRLGKYDYVPAGGVPAPVVKAIAPAPATEPIKKPNIKLDAKPAGDPEPVVQKPVVDEPKPVVIGQKRT